MDAKEFIQKTVTENPVVLFMKGTAQFPQCGFSGRAVQILKACGIRNLVTVNVLEDDEVRQAIKDFANWPTIPRSTSTASSSAARTSCPRCISRASCRSCCPSRRPPERLPGAGPPDASPPPCQPQESQP